MKNLRWLATLMGITILGIAGFQLYWLKNNYDREKQALEIKTNAAFRQTILHLQATKLKLEIPDLKIDSFSHKRINLEVKKSGNRSLQSERKEPVITVLNLLQEKMKNSIWIDSNGKKNIIISFNNNHAGPLNDSLHGFSDNALQTAIKASEISHRLKNEFSDSSNNKGGKKDNREKAVPINYTGKKQGKAIKNKITTNNTNEVILKDDLSVIPGKNEFIGKQSEDFLPDKTVFRFLYNVDSLSLQDSVTIKEITTAYTTRLKEDKTPVAFTVIKKDSTHKLPEAANDITIGFLRPVTYHLTLQNTFAYLVKKLTLPILFSLFLVGITIISFVLLYRNLIKQHKLAALKNEFISNITHELKTPIATVGVAIEALRNFNAIHDPQRTKEYLDISSNELQRLSLLVDKVLKLSMFEKKEIELKYETVNLKEVVDEVATSMRLQMEKYHTKISITNDGDLNIAGDRLHLLSVVFNLLDNALKYSKGDPAIHIDLKEKDNNVVMTVTDNGIGIPSEYKNKLFEKFFRVPAGDTHNAKGYGLGLSYVAHVIRKHRGSISVDSQPGTGSKFVITLPKQQS
jgi:two-component system phosphate regulon sensor histidine kinase PhoR